MDGEGGKTVFVCSGCDFADNAFSVDFCICYVKRKSVRFCGEDWSDCDEYNCLLCWWIFLWKEKYEKKIFMGTGGRRSLLSVFCVTARGDGAVFYRR